MVFAHPSGFMAIVALLLPLAFLGIKGWRIERENNRRIMLPLLTTIVVAFTYWIYTYIITLMVHRGVSVYSTVLSYFSGVTAEGSPWYIPRYYLSGNEIFAYAWAAPAALSAALLLSTIFQFIRKRRFDTCQSLTVVSAFAGLLITLLAYLSYQRGEGGQYLIVVGYFLLLLSSSVVAIKLLTSRSRKYVVIAAALLALFVFVGMYSPDWAPLEHPNFESSATIHPYHVYIEAEAVTPLIPNNATVYYDYDFPIRGGIYKSTRNVILQVSSGADLTQFARPPITLYGIREERFLGNIVLDWDTVYSSGYHRIVAVQLG
jgi:hypothetical protein